MQAVIDNDVLRKLARYDLLHECARLLKVRDYHPRHGTLATARYALRLGKPDAARWPDDRQRASLVTFLNAECSAVTGQNYARMEALAVPRFDSGEVQLVASVLDVPEAVFFTGDKHALRALASDPRLAGFAAQLVGRCVHFEMMVSALGQRLGWARTAAAIRNAAEDATLSRIFNSSSEAQINRDLTASIETLRLGTNGLLAQF